MWKIKNTPYFANETFHDCAEKNEEGEQSIQLIPNHEHFFDCIQFEYSENDDDMMTHKLDRHRIKLKMRKLVANFRTITKNTVSIKKTTTFHTKITMMTLPNKLHRLMMNMKKLFAL